MNNILDTITNEIFSQDFDTINDDQYDDMVNQAERLVENFGWKEVFEVWSKYLYSNCKSYSETLNFANWFYGVGGCNHKIENPYKFLGYLYFRIDLKNHFDDAMTIMDSISIEILSNSGYQDQVGWAENTRYIPELDPQMIASIEQWKLKEHSQ